MENNPNGEIAQPAAPEPPKPLDDPRLQQLFTWAIDGALTSGYQGVAPPPVGHWLEYWWQKGCTISLRETLGEEERQKLLATQAQPATPWRPMRTAPKNGVAILVLMCDSDIPKAVRWVDADNIGAIEGPGWYMTWDGYKLSPHDGPRYWMEIPGDPDLASAPAAGETLTAAAEIVPLTDAEIIVQAPSSMKNVADTITFARWVEERTRAAIATQAAPAKDSAKVLGVPAQAPSGYPSPSAPPIPDAAGSVRSDE